MLTNNLLFHSRSKRAGSRLTSSFFLFSSCFFCKKREPQTRVGLVTSSLPRKRSTTELLRLFSFALSLFEYLSFRNGAWGLSCFPLLSGRRGSNPPPIAWKAIALPNELLPPVEVGLRGGGWTRTTELFRGQIYSLLQLPLCDSPSVMHSIGTALSARADEGTRTPDRLITNQLLYQLSYIGFIQPFKQLFFSLIEGAKILLFPNTTKDFFYFFSKFSTTC